METTGIQMTRSPRVPVATIVAVAIALLLGAALGSLITSATAADAPTASVAATWDTQKLDAMAGRQLFTATPVAAIPWDQQKLDAMAARQLAR